MLVCGGGSGRGSDSRRAASSSNRPAYQETNLDDEDSSATDTLSLHSDAEAADRLLRSAN